VALETEADRAALGLPVGHAFEPLHGAPGLKALVLVGGRERRSKQGSERGSERGDKGPPAGGGGGTRAWARVGSGENGGGGGREPTLEELFEAGRISAGEYHRRLAGNGDGGGDGAGVPRQGPPRQQARLGAPSLAVDQGALGSLPSLLPQQPQQQRQLFQPSRQQEPPAGPGAVAVLAVRDRSGRQGVAVTNVGQRPTPQPGKSWVRTRPAR